jgi:hypothetical protein
MPTAALPWSGAQRGIPAMSLARLGRCGLRRAETAPHTTAPTNPPGKGDPAMASHPHVDRIERLLSEARELAQDEHAMVRVTGARIAVILADLLYEIDPERAEVFSLLPAQR